MSLTGDRSLGLMSKGSCWFSYLMSKGVPLPCDLSHDAFDAAYLYPMNRHYLSATLFVGSEYPSMFRNYRKESGCVMECCQSLTSPMSPITHNTHVTQNTYICHQPEYPCHPSPTTPMSPRTPMSATNQNTHVTHHPEHPYHPSPRTPMSPITHHPQHRCHPSPTEPSPS